jgi:glycine reductase complex component B subunit alpha and beta
LRLVLQHHRIRDVEWSAPTRLEGGVLAIHREALVALLLEDQRISSVTLDVARPGESCRIYPVFDVVEPRCKVGDAGSDYPGVVGPVLGVGSGTTAVLRGMAVTIVSPEPFNPDAPIMSQMLEMQPLAVDEANDVQLETNYGELVHLVVLPQCIPGLDRYERSNALRRAVLRASVFLARAAHDEPPDEEEVYELELGNALTPELPRIAYVFQLHSHQRPTAPGEPILYGDNARHLLPTILHPNEVLDGGVLPGYNSMGMETYAVQNHGVILDLYGRHGRDIDFAGVVAVVAHQTVDERARTNVMAANLVRHVLRADGAVFTKSGGGAPHVAMAEVARQCELLGVKTSLLAWEISEGETGGEGSALFNYPELNAIVNYGCNGFGVALPAVERVITTDPELAPKLARAMDVNANRLCGAMDQLGSGVLTAARY